MITDSHIPSNIFDNIVKLWNTTIKYNITTYPNSDLKHDPLYYLEDTFIRTRSFSKYMSPPEEDYNIENQNLTFQFYGHEDYLNDWGYDSSEEDTLEYEKLNKYCFIPDCIQEWEYDACLLYWFKRNLSYELYNLNNAYKKLSIDLDSKDLVNITQDDLKCIAGCKFNTNHYARDLGKLNTLYCNVCLPTYMHIPEEEHYNKFRQHLLNILRGYEAEFNDIINFLKDPLPQVIDFGKDGKLELV